jgi:type I restriction enzyme M protein
MMDNNTPVVTKKRRIKIKKKKIKPTPPININTFIKNSYNYLDDINQFCHNKGILFDIRIDIILNILSKKQVDQIDEDTYNFIEEKLNNNVYSREELIQKIFMFYGNNVLKKNFDQFYTPLSIGKFMCELCNDNNSAIDPACGTGDLIVYYKKNKSITLWDISKEVISLTKINYKFQNMNATISEVDSIINFDKDNEAYDYVFLNPPFGSKTVITDSTILQKYELGRNLKKQEIGILFIERSINLLKENGVAFIIVPAGYVGNSNNNIINLRKYLLKYRIISLIKLPPNSFSRSGTGVSTYLIIINKQLQKEDYNIHIKEVNTIGYELNKKNTPLKFKKEANNYITNNEGFPILDNDFDYIKEEIYHFCFMNDLNCLKMNRTNCDYEQINTNEIKNNNYILDIGRYLNIYKNCITKIENKIRIIDLIDKEYNLSFNKLSSTLYTYLDIKEVSTPFYNGKKLYGYELPGRASYKLKKNDILVSKLKGNISFTLILNEEDNIICTNGFVVLRPKDEESLTIIFANLFSKEFKIQHNALTTGSIMETISEDDLKDIVLTKNIDNTKYQTIIKSLRIIKNELS